MANMKDYFEWRGDIPITVDGINEIDGAIFSIIAYFDFSVELEGRDEIGLKDASTSYMKRGEIDIRKNKLNKMAAGVYRAAGKSKRFGKLTVSDYEEIFDAEKKVQFGAVTFTIDENTHFVAFRGTDDSIVGWAEDFELCYKMPVPSQVEAERYLKHIAEKYSGKIYVGGHSKGGNLAIYSSFRQSQEIKKRIAKIYNYDGPGFLQPVIESEEYISIVDKICTYMPQESMVGIIMFHGEKINIVKCEEKGIIQHQPETWKLCGTRFIYEKTFKNKSVIINDMCNKWLTRIDEKKRETFIITLFGILQEENADTFTELSFDWFNNAKSAFHNYRSLDKETKDMIRETLKEMEKLGKTSLTKRRRNKTPV